MVLIVGSTGLVGTEICRLLAEQKIPFRALIRKDSAAGKIEILKSLGAELVVGDLKDPASIADACAGIDKIVSTASCTLTGREGDSIETVDHQGELDLVKAAKNAGVKRFVFISFPQNHTYPNPLCDAKRAVEEALADSKMTVSSLQANYFMEVWLSPALGFDFENGKARVYGSGDSKLSWISFKDVARFAAAALQSDFAANKIVSIGGPEALSPKEIIQIFEKTHGKNFEIEHVPTEALEQQKLGSPYPLEQSFAALMLAYANGIGFNMDMSETAKHIATPLTSVEDYAMATKG